MRLFIAIELPADLKKAVANLRKDIPGARWVLPDQIHLTLAFLGDVEEPVAAQLKRELSCLRIPPFKLRFAGTGCFPDRRRPRVLWLGLEPEPHLHALAAAVHSAVLACGIPQEERPFSPHITLARLKLPAAREAAAFFDQQPTRKLPPLFVHECILFQSSLTAAGAVHIPLQRFPLTPVNSD